MGDISQRIDQLLFRQGTVAPVGEARRLVELHAGQAVDELVVGNRVAKTTHHGGHLRVEDRVRDQPAQMEDDFDILPRRMENLHDIGVGHQFEKRLQADARCARINQHLKVGAGDLDQAQFRPEGGFAEKLRINRHELRCGKRSARFFKLGGCFDHLFLRLDYE